MLTVKVRLRSEEAIIECGFLTITGDARVPGTFRKEEADDFRESNNGVLAGGDEDGDLK